MESRLGACAMGCNSMTGFGYTVFQGRFTSIKVDARTVNHRFAEFNIRLPRELSKLEEDIRTLLNQRIARGRVDLYISFEQTTPLPKSVVVDWSLLDSLTALEHELTVRYPERENPNLHYDWLTYPDVIQIQSQEIDAEALRSEVLVAVGQALDSLCEMRVREGTRLKSDMELKLQSLDELVSAILVRVPEAEANFREKLRHRMIEVANEVDESKLMSEIATWIERQTIDEELVRLRSHIFEFHETLERGSPAGRKLDFIVQEMHREINTIGSKSNDLVISKCVVDVKVIVEQLREQTQNIE